MRALKTVCVLFATIFGITAIACVYNLFRPDSPNSAVEMVLLGIVMVLLSDMCVFGAKKAGDRAKESGSGVILKTRIVDAYGKTSTASAITRSVAGNVVAGPIGAVVGASTSKSNRSTTFLIIYENGKKVTRTVPNNSFEYQKYIKYLDE